MPLSQKQLEKERSGRKSWITHIVSDHNSKFQNFQKFQMSQKRLEKERNGRKFWVTHRVSDHNSQFSKFQKN